MPMLRLVLLALICIAAAPAPAHAVNGQVAPPRELAAAPDDLERILADLERDLAPIAAWRVRAEEALRPRARTPQADAAFLALRLELKDIIGTLARRFQTREFQMLVGPAGFAGQHLRRSSGLPEGVSAADAQRAEIVVAFMKQRAVWPRYAEGDTYFYVNESALLEWFGNAVSEEIRQFLRIWAHEQATPMAEDAGLMVSLDEVERRMADAKRFLADYPGSAVREPMRAAYQQRLAVYLGGLPNSPAFDHLDGVMDVDRRQRLEAYVGAHPGTESARIVEQYLALLRANGFKRGPEVDRFLRALWDRVDSLQLRY
jgi:hypothetical protein